MVMIMVFMVFLIVRRPVYYTTWWPKLCRVLLGAHLMSARFLSTPAESSEGIGLFLTRLFGLRPAFASAPALRAADGKPRRGLEETKRVQGEGEMNRVAAVA